MTTDIIDIVCNIFAIIAMASLTMVVFSAAVVTVILAWKIIFSND